MNGTHQPATTRGPRRPRRSVRRAGGRSPAVGEARPWVTRARRGGWALTRWVMLVVFSGLGAAAVIAAVVAGLIIAINGSLS